MKLCVVLKEAYVFVLNWLKEKKIKNKETEKKR